MSASIASPEPQAAAVDFSRIGEELQGALTLDDVAKAGRVSKPTVVRWTREGVKTSDGRVHRLPSMRVGARRWVRPSDFAEFLRRMNAASGE